LYREDMRMLFAKSKCKNCEYLYALIDKLLLEHRHLLDQLLIAKQAVPITPEIIDEPKENKELTGEQYGVE